jgi:hypothetical protein
LWSFRRASGRKEGVQRCGPDKAPRPELDCREPSIRDGPIDCCPGNSYGARRFRDRKARRSRFCCGVAIDRISGRAGKLPAASCGQCLVQRVCICRAPKSASVPLALFGAVWRRPSPRLLLGARQGLFRKAADHGFQLPNQFVRGLGSPVRIMRAERIGDRLHLRRLPGRLPSRVRVWRFGQDARPKSWRVSSSRPHSRFPLG